MSTPTLLVTGASGKLGRHVTELLLTTGAKVIAASRDTSKLADLAAKGAHTRLADFDDPDSLAEAFKGVDRVLIISTDALGSGQRLRQHLAAVEAANIAGVKEILYTSMPKPEGSAVIFAGDHLGTENAIKASGLAYTILRNAWYQENLLMMLPHALASGTHYSSAGEGRISHVSHADCARAAAAALLRPSTNETFTLTGPDLFTFADIAALASDVTGKPLAVVTLTDEQLAAGMKAGGAPEFLIPMLVSFDTTTREGGFDVLTGDVELLTGQKPQSLRAFLEANKPAL